MTSRLLLPVLLAAGAVGAAPAAAVTIGAADPTVPAPRDGITRFPVAVELTDAERTVVPEMTVHWHVKRKA